MSHRRRKTKNRLLTALAAAALYVSAADVSAQCPLCRAGLEQAGYAKALNLGILVLLVPPVAIFCTIFAAAYRKSKGGGDDES
ncbi:MAG TPA: hypothetical protein VGX48_18405 [Pyrinomonadaceae bacterium]|nr:hypothetical protein [Pyrinomonadaceae bacterium]